MSELPKKIETTPESVEQDTEDLHDFYTVEKDLQKLTVKNIRFRRLAIVERLKKMGYFSHKTGDNRTIVKVDENRISLSDDEDVITAFERFVLSLPDNVVSIQSKSDNDESDGTRNFTITPRYIQERLYDNLQSYFSKIYLNRLIPNEPIKILKDSAHEKFIFFQNTAVSISKSGIRPIPYKLLVDHIWESAIISRDFFYTKEKGDFETFTERITGPGDRHRQFMSIIGYLVHDFYEIDLRAIFFTDANLQEAGRAKGGTGKGLIGKAIAQFLNRNPEDTTYIAIPGKGLDLHKDTKYSMANINTQIIHIEDAEDGFDMKMLYNDITDGAKIRKIYQEPIIKYVKMMVSLNHTLKMDRDSDRRRALIFELTNYYSSKHRPSSEFRWFFGHEWTEKDWNQFYSFMCRCVLLYMGNGLLEPSEINYTNRTLLEALGAEFVVWFREKIQFYVDKELECEFDKHVIFMEYAGKYDIDAGEKNRKKEKRIFTKKCQDYCTIKSIPYCEIRSTNDLFIIYPSEANKTKARREQMDF